MLNKIVEMKKMVTTLIFLMIAFDLIAPVSGRAVIVMTQPVYIYNVSDPFLRAVIRYESNYQERAVNPISKARGILQILPVMIREANKYSEVKYTWNDAFDPVKSIEIWYTVQGGEKPGVLS